VIERELQVKVDLMMKRKWARPEQKGCSCQVAPWVLDRDHEPGLSAPGLLITL
jgi:hypothetical protein